jgi:site-specific recombinase XerD
MKQKGQKRQKARTGFLAFLNCETEHQRQNGHISLANNYASAGNSLSRFLRTKGKTDISFKKMTSLLVTDYEAWLQANGLCRNTTSFYIRALQSVYQQYRYALCRYNVCLDMLGRMLGGLKLTSYVSRHSWASAARQQNVPLSVISQSMGHNSEKTTEIYLKSLECNVINKTNHDLLNNVFRKTRRSENVRKM